MNAGILKVGAVSRLPAPPDNAAIAVRRLEAGTQIDFGDEVLALGHTVLEGHRFAVRPIDSGEALSSWGLPFGFALRPIARGEYLCNESVLKALAQRDTGAVLPGEPNFGDRLIPYRLEPGSIPAAPPTGLVGRPRTFLGFRRAGGRGVGTRNTLVVLGTTSRTASYARALAARLQPMARGLPGLDAVVAIAHTEGDGPGEPNNAPEVLRTLAGFVVHPNVGAILAADFGTEAITNARLMAYLRSHGYPLDAVPHQFLTLTGRIGDDLDAGERAARRLLDLAAGARRSEEPVSGLRIALQCGGSDAFSGVSGNPLAGAMVHEVVRNGGSGNLCETDEAIGAESYLLANIADETLARALLDKVESFKRRLGWHGISAESNPSAGNKLRGLYNIVLKSLGATHKKDPRTRIDAVIDYADPMGAPGFYFMNSPGNDLEGIAGQVAAGCNLFLFATGNGSITNFPFVPTLKITTTTRRHELLVHEMDINAGRYLDGEPMEALAAEAFELLLETASGRRSKGELAGHSQAQLWRNWRQTDDSRLAQLRARPVPDGKPVADAGGIVTDRRLPPLRLFNNGGRWAVERVGLVLPTSMCSAQVALMAAGRLNARAKREEFGVSRFVGLAHTEGCGFGGETMYGLLHRTYRGYVTHPNVAAALLLEHGCEKIPNDVMRRQLGAAGLELDRFGWASVQLDGGIEKALEKVQGWFLGRLKESQPPAREAAGWGALCVGVACARPPGESAARAFASVVRSIVGAGGSVLLPEGDPLIGQAAFRSALPEVASFRATLAYGEPLAKPGLHVVATESDHWAENLTGLGGCGAHLFLALVGGQPRAGHPMLPVAQVAEAGSRDSIAEGDVDLFLSGDAAADEAALIGLVAAVAQGELTPAASAKGMTDFQLTRGMLGVST